MGGLGGGWDCDGACGDREGGAGGLAGRWMRRFWRMTHMAPMETAQGYVPPSVTQFSVFLANRIGKMHELVGSFDEHPDVHVCALSVHEASDHAVVRLITNNAAAARKLLREHELAFSEMDVLVVELAEGLTLSRLCLYLLGAEINIRFSYPVMLRPNGTPTIALSVEDPVLAGQILRRKRFRLLGECDLPKPGCTSCDEEGHGRGHDGHGGGSGGGGMGNRGSGRRGGDLGPGLGGGGVEEDGDHEDDDWRGGLGGGW